MDHKLSDITVGDLICLFVVFSIFVLPAIIAVFGRRRK